MGPGFSPLDERLGLRPGSALTPWLVESIVRLGALAPFAQIPPLLAHFTGVAVSAETVRRLTEAAGVAAAAMASEAVAALEHTLPAPPVGPAVQQLSVDGAMVPLVGGEWAEVKTLVLGTVRDGHATDLSYYARLTDAETFGHGAIAETHRRGTATAGTVVAVSDGARWCQGFVDLHRPDAVRVLDFPHALEHLGAVAQVRFGPGTEAASAWLGRQAHALRHGQEDTVLTELDAHQQVPGLDAATRDLFVRTRAYLASRRAQIRYQDFVAAGYPIGSGCVESANKLLVEARLKGAGMHWARDNVDPMLAVRTLLANDRWAELWPAIWARLRHPPRDPGAATRPPPPGDPAAPPVASQDSTPARPAPPPRRAPGIAAKPAADHPWRRSSRFPAKR